FSFYRLRLPPVPTLLPYTTLFRSAGEKDADYLYLDLPGNLQASFGERAPLRAVVLLERSEGRVEARLEPVAAARAMRLLVGQSLDRKSTRLNSSHVKSSYAVFCLK